MKVLVGISGGVDSAATASYLLEQGYEVSACYLEMIDQTHGIESAREVADKLQIPFYTVDKREAFQQNVIQPFLDYYQKGLTPNPCGFCNPTCKIGGLLELADQLGIEYVATGHYAKIVQNQGYQQIARADYRQKDQSYFLSLLRYDQIQRLIFPLGCHTKPEVRKQAEKWGFSCASAGESQDICFVSGEYGDFVEQQLGISSEEGNAYDMQGKCIGTHRGHLHYTIGQRKGLGIALGYPCYVVSKNAFENKIILGSNDDLMQKRLYIQQLNIQNSEQTLPEKCLVQIRSRHQAQSAEILSFHSNDSAMIQFEEAQRAIAFGQIASFYEGDILLGGGIIREETKS